MRISDWSSDVCSSDLKVRSGISDAGGIVQSPLRQPSSSSSKRGSESATAGKVAGRLWIAATCRSEERRVGKECVVRVDLGGRRIIKKKKSRTTKRTK